MTAPAMNLSEMQRTMAAAVTMPLTADEAMRSHAEDGRGMDQVASSFIAPNSRLSAFERLEIYNRQYWYRVLGALAEDFPALRGLVGARRFEALSIAYLTAHPSRSFTLRNLGSKLAEWLGQHPRFAGRRHALAVDVARIEWAFVEAFDSGERTPLTLDQISTLDGGSRLALQPHVQLLALNFPADELVLELHHRDKRQASEAGVRHEDNEDASVALPRMRPRPLWVAAHRLNDDVYYRRLEREEFDTLRALRHGQPLGLALEAAFATSRMAGARRPRAVQRWFAAWAELGWITAPDIESLLET